MIKTLDQQIVCNELQSHDTWDFMPCPFCGGHDIGAQYQTIDLKMNGADTPCSALNIVQAYCRYCGAQGRRKTVDIVYNSEIVAAAIEGWNRRAADDQT